MRVTVGSLFSGIGGLDLGLERAGMTVIWNSEVDPYCCKVLAKHWPHVPNLGDVTKIDWSKVERPDVICGGYPCQPFSLAGSRSGEDDARHLWPYMVGAIRVLRPRFAIMENVPGHLSLGFGRVLGDLAESGYDTEWDCIPAAAVGAPHRRDRVFIVAYANSERLEGSEHERVGIGVESVCSDLCCQVPNPDRGRLEVLSQLHGEPLPHPTDGHPRGRHADGFRHEAPDASVLDAEHGRDRWRVEQPSCGEGSRGAHKQWGSEPDVGRVADGVPSRVDRLRGLGNAVVPQVAEFIGRQLMAVCE